MAEIVKITFPDGALKEFPFGTTTEEIAQSISPGLRKKALAGKLNGKLLDLRTPIEEDGAIEIVTPEHEDALGILRHSTAHLMAQAVRRLYGNVKFGVGPAIENGFYYDMDLEVSLTPEDLPKIEKEMKKIVAENLEIVRKVVSRDEARKIFAHDEYKLELIDAIPDETVTVYEQGEFVDLCRGVHVPSTGKIKEFKLLNIAGAYWRGDSNNKMMQRIYGTAFFKKEDLEAHLKFRKKQKNATTGKSGKNSNFSRTRKKSDKACRSGCQKAQRSAAPLNGILSTRKSNSAMTTSIRRCLAAWTCIKRAATGTITRKICSRS